MDRFGVAKLDKIIARLNREQEQQAAHRVNRNLFAFTLHAKFDQLPLKQIYNMLEKNGFSAKELRDHFVSEKIPRSGKLHKQIGPRSIFELAWRRDEDGKYEIIAHVA
jgi:hypothetical protein